MTRRRDGLDLNDSVDLIRDNLGRADAFITAVEELIERTWNNDGADDDDDCVGRRRNHVAHLIEAAKLAVRAAIYAGSGVATELDRRRKGP